MAMLFDSLEVEGYLFEWNYVQQEFPETAPINVGNMGTVALSATCAGGVGIEVKSIGEYQT